MEDAEGRERKTLLTCFREWHYRQLHLPNEEPLIFLYFPYKSPSIYPKELFKIELREDSDIFAQERIQRRVTSP